MVSDRLFGSSTSPRAIASEIEGTRITRVDKEQRTGLGEQRFADVDISKHYQVQISTLTNSLQATSVSLVIAEF